MCWGVAQSGMAVALNRMANPGGERLRHSIDRMNIVPHGLCFEKPCNGKEQGSAGMARLRVATA